LNDGNLAPEFDNRDANPLNGDNCQIDLDAMHAANKKVHPVAERVLRRLVIENECESEFIDGLTFGTYFGLLGKMETEARLTEAKAGRDLKEWLPLFQQLENERRQQLSALMLTQVVVQCDAAHSVLVVDSDVWHSGAAVFVLPDESFDVCSYYDNLDHSVSAFWVCVGALWRHLQDFPSKLVPNRLPREFLSRRATSVPMLRAGIEIAEKELHSRRPIYPPAEIVLHLVAGIEPLVRSLWPESGDIGDVLSAKARNGDWNTKRFASIANSVFRTYRNLAIHRGHTMDQKVDSWAEAMFVYSATKLLLELHDRIKRRQGDK